MLNEQKVSWKNLNWEKGLDRLYNVVWGVAAVIALIPAVSARNTLEAMTVYVLYVLVAPAVLKLLLKWIIQGFQK